MDVSFCITARNRKEVLEKTLAFNLGQLQDFKNAMISLVDYGSSDELSPFIWKKFSNYIKTGKLLFFEVKNQVNWSAPKAKNLSHRISNANYLFNLDADNFIVKDDIESVLMGSRKNLPSHQFTGDLTDGTYGRIGLPSKTFFEIGGYDEGLLSMGFQDRDIILRSCLQHRMLIFRLAVSKSFVKPIKNSKKKSLSSFDTIHQLDELSAEKLWSDMNILNAQRASMRLRLEGHKIKGGFSSYCGLLNGIEVTIDGFGNIARSNKPIFTT